MWQINIIVFKNCSFVNNSNMKSILYILLLNSLSANVLIDIRYTTFVGNNDTQIIKSKSKVQVLWQVTHYIILINTRISSNRLRDNLISSTNGFIKFINSAIIGNNIYNTAIIQSYFSVITFQDYNEISSNQALFILDSLGGSYNIFKQYSKIDITKNLVHSVMSADFLLNDESKPICYFQLSVINMMWRNISVKTIY